MRRAVVAVLVAAWLAAGCGGSPSAQPAPTAPAKTKSQLAAEKLLAQLRAEGGCHCGAAERARERVTSGRVKVHPDGYVLTP